MKRSVPGGPGEAGSPGCGHPRGLGGGCRVSSWSQSALFLLEGSLLCRYVYYEPESWKSSRFLLVCSRTANYFLLFGGAKCINTWTPRLKKLGLRFSPGWIGVEDDAVYRDLTQMRTKCCAGGPRAGSGGQQLWARAEGQLTGFLLAENRGGARCLQLGCGSELTEEV